MNRRPLLRLVALALLAWIAVDLAAIDTCALHVDSVLPSGSGTGARVQTPGESHAAVPLHPDHCVCHSPVLTPGTPVGLAAPALMASAMGGPASCQPHGLSAALYHPPQLLS